MGAGVDDGVRLAAVGQVLRVGVLREGELEDVHAGEPGVLKELVDVGGQDAEVFGDELRAVEPVAQHAEQAHAGAVVPLALLRGLRVVGAGPVGRERAEVVEAEDVIHLDGAFDAADPPAEAVLAHGVPVVERVAPELAVLGEVVRRDAGDLLRDVLLVELEELRLAPDVGGVRRDVDR